MNRVSWLIVLALVLLVPSVLGVSSSDFGTTGPILASCSDLTDFTTLVSGVQPDSSLGFGAVDICTNCYPCGRDDGICPEDFYNGSTAGSCSAAPDSDCGGCSFGQTYINLSGLGLQALPNIQIYINYQDPNLASQNGVLVPTGTAGDFNISVVANANATVWASYTDPFPPFGQPPSVYISQVVNITDTDVTRTGSCFALPDLILQEAGCDNSCTRGANLPCDASCAGVNGCTYSAGMGYTSQDVANAVDGKFPGEYAALGQTVNSAACTAEDFYVTACTSPVQSTTSFLISGQTCSEVSYDESILNLVTRVHRIWYNVETGAKPLELVIMHWDEDETN